MLVAIVLHDNIATIIYISTVSFNSSIVISTPATSTSANSLEISESIFRLLLFI